MQFLNPIAFFALAGLLIPVLIHLWRRKNVKTLKVGSLNFLSETVLAQSKSLRLKDLLLLLIRCLILICAVMLLAKPFFDFKLFPSQKGWILVEKGYLKDAYHQNRQYLDSLMKSGYELRAFEKPFPALSLEDTLKTSELENKSLNFFSLFNELNDVLPPNFEAKVFSSKLLKNFHDHVPRIRYSLDWHEISLLDSGSIWYQSSLGRTYKISSGKTQNRAVQVEKANDQQTIDYFLVAEDVNDSKYLLAALKSISNFSAIKFRQTKDASKSKLVFLLTEKQFSRQDFPENSTVLQYRSGRPISVSQRISLGQYSQDEIELRKRIAFDQSDSMPIWLDAFGETLLGFNPTENCYSLYTKLNPQWCDMVWKPVFVEQLYTIIQNAIDTKSRAFEINESDQRRLSLQFKSSIASSNQKSISSSAQLPIWLLLFVLLLLERILSFQKGRVKA